MRKDIKDIVVEGEWVLKTGPKLPWVGTAPKAYISPMHGIREIERSLSDCNSGDSGCRAIMVATAQTACTPDPSDQARRPHHL